MSSNELLVIKDKVQRFATQMFTVVQVGDNGKLSIPFESTHVFIEVVDLAVGETAEMKAFREEHDISKTIVNIWAVVLIDVKASADLFKWIATDGQDYDFGGFRILLDPNDATTGEIQYQYRLAGDTLDPGEFKSALAVVAFTADNNDDELQRKFGGKRVQDIRQ